jgi:hypothetical protein
MFNRAAPSPILLASRQWALLELLLRSASKVFRIGRVKAEVDDWVVRGRWLSRSEELYRLAEARQLVGRGKERKLQDRRRVGQRAVGIARFSVGVEVR